MSFLIKPDHGGAVHADTGGDIPGRVVLRVMGDDDNLGYVGLDPSEARAVAHALGHCADRLDPPDPRLNP